MTEKNTSSSVASFAQGRSIWDNDLPAGDSPPLPRWPLIASIVVYCLWMVFLIAMLIVRLTYTG
ncbi:MAG: hypothetical protein GXY44_00265 [Phycisphaerales bacterium]|nr:hypothetical protein [Phycisphaerales bacterium]